MSTRERCHMLLDELSDTMIDEIIAYIDKLKLEDEADDMEFCLALARELETAITPL